MTELRPATADKSLGAEPGLVSLQTGADGLEVEAPATVPPSPPPPLLAATVVLVKVSDTSPMVRVVLTAVLLEAEEV